MKKIAWSRRLEAVAGLIPQNRGPIRLADIGSDHAHLPCRLIQDGRVSFAIAGEVREGPYLKAQDNVRMLGLADKVSVRLGDGLEVIEPGEVDVVVIAGMGGELMASILDSGRSKLTEKTMLVLQPNSREPHCRQWLAAHGWTIVDEQIVKEDGHFYEMMRAENKGGHPRLTDSERLMGPLLSRSRPQAFREKWHRRLNHLQQVLRRLEAANRTDSIRMKRAACLRETAVIRRCLFPNDRCLTTEKK